MSIIGLGTSTDVPTLDGRVSAKAPAGTQPDTVLWLRGTTEKRQSGGNVGS